MGLAGCNSSRVLAYVTPSLPGPFSSPLHFSRNLAEAILDMTHSAALPGFQMKSEIDARWCPYM